MAENEYLNAPEWDDEDDSLEIDWMGLILKLARGWKFIAVCVMIAGVLGVVVALMTPKKYTVSVTLAPESQGRSGGGSLSGLTSMLGLGSVGSSSPDALNINLFPDISKSSLFLTQLFDVQVTPYVSDEDVLKGVTAQPTTLYKYITKDGQEPGLMERLKESLFGKKEKKTEPDSINIASLSAKQRSALKALRNSVGAEVDKKTGIVTIGVTLDDPWIATTLADTVCRRLQEYVIAYRTKKTSTDLAYYEKLAEEAKEKMVKTQSAYAVSVDYDRSVILQSVNSEKERLQREAQLAGEIYNQMAQQVEMAKAKLQEEKPVFAVIESASMPAYPSSTSRKRIVLAFLFVGGCLSAVWKLFGEDFWASVKAQYYDRLQLEKSENAESAEKK